MCSTSNCNYTFSDTICTSCNRNTCYQRVYSTVSFAYQYLLSSFRWQVIEPVWLFLVVVTPLAVERVEGLCHSAGRGVNKNHCFVVATPLAVQGVEGRCHSAVRGVNRNHCFVVVTPLTVKGVEGRCRFAGRGVNINRCSLSLPLHWQWREWKVVVTPLVAEWGRVSLGRYNCTSSEVIRLCVVFFTWRPLKWVRMFCNVRLDCWWSKDYRNIDQTWLYEKWIGKWPVETLHVQLIYHKKYTWLAVPWIQKI